jgi:hypothetical protein
MPDLRYHLISLISVFLALAIGILLGVAMADRGVVSARMQAEIASIQRQLDRQEGEIDRQNKQIADQEAMLAGISEVVISGSLQDEDVALVSGPYADPDVAEAVQGDLSEAGASITKIETLDRPEPAEITLLENTTPQAMTRLEDDYADDAREILGFTGEVEDDPPEIVVFVGGGEIPDDAPPATRDALNDAQAEMFEVWLDARVRVVGAEPSEAGRSEVPLFQNAGIPSVDNADQPAGRAAIIQCAATDCEGSYGIKDRASEPFPPPG